MPSLAQRRREELEKSFWRDNPRIGSLDDLTSKAGELPVFREEITLWRHIFADAGTILELGAGQAWASCFVKRLFPSARVIATDISPDALAAAATWEAFIDAELDETIACRCYEVPLPADSVDLAFTFQAAHHFGDHDATLAEMARILRPGGTLLYLYEPTCSRLTYAPALRRVTRLRPEVQEDLLVLRDLQCLAEAHRFDFEAVPRLTLHRTGLKRALYYALLRAAPALTRVLPCGADIRFTKVPATAQSEI